ncbi:hypothetical protein BJ742DRAFT_777937 [Cladochytrium replicatum]|nr:hypothetical protein BJ742DRAFT_777937 [Cladochytrium replicatum]
MAVEIDGVTFEVLDLFAFACVGLAFVLTVGRLLLHTIMSTIGKDKTVYHNSITIALSAIIVSQVSGVIFRVNQLRTEQALNYNVTPEDIPLITKVTGGISVVSSVVAGLAFGITTLNRFKPFADGFGFYRHTNTILMVLLFLLGATSCVGMCLFVLEYRNRFVTVTNSLFWVYTVFFDMFVMFAMVWATVAKKRVIFLSSHGQQSDPNSNDSSNTRRRKRPNQCLKVLQVLLPTLKRSDRSLISLLVLIIFLDLLALLCYVGAAFFRKGFVAIQMFNANGIIAFYMLVAIEFLSQFRNVLKLEGRRRQKEERSGTKLEDGTVQLTSYFNTLDQPNRCEIVVGEDAPRAGSSGARSQPFDYSRGGGSGSGAHLNRAPIHRQTSYGSLGAQTNQFGYAESGSGRPLQYLSRAVTQQNSNGSLRSAQGNQFGQSEPVTHPAPFTQPGSAPVTWQWTGARDGGGSHCIMFSASIQFVASRSDELDLRLGDTIQCTRTFPDGWALGVNLRTGKAGMFPLNSVAVVEKPLNPFPPMQSSSSSYSQDTTDQSQQHLPPPPISPEIFPSPANSQRDRKEPIRVVTAAPPERPYAAPITPVSTSISATIPTNIVAGAEVQVKQIIPQPAAVVPEVPSAGPSGRPIRIYDSAAATAIRAFDPAYPDELKLRLGDRLTVAAEYDDGFAYGANLSAGGTRGMFPLSYCEWTKDPRIVGA